MTKQLFYAIETTHPNPELSAIHQIGGVVVVDGVPVESFGWNVAPHQGALIDRNVLTACGLDVDAMGRYESPALACSRLRHTLEKYVRGCERDDLLVICDFGGGHGDNLALSRFFIRNGHTDFDKCFWRSDIDVRQLAADFLLEDCQKLGEFDRHTVAVRLGINPDPSREHDALYNAWLTYEIYKRVSVNTRK